MKPASITVSVNGAVVNVRELDVSEIRARLRGDEIGRDMPPPGDDAIVDWQIIRHITIDDVPMRDILAMSDVTQAQLDAACPSDLAELVEAIKKTNRDFFAARARLAKLLATAVPELSLPTSAPPPAVISSAPSVH